jgi:hypothetical protein
MHAYMHLRKRRAGRGVCLLVCMRASMLCLREYKWMHAVGEELRGRRYAGMDTRVCIQGADTFAMALYTFAWACRGVHATNGQVLLVSPRTPRVLLVVSIV